MLLYAADSLSVRQVALFCCVLHTMLLYAADGVPILLELRALILLCAANDATCTVSQALQVAYNVYCLLAYINLRCKN
jgi:hypothetical protein